ncbi:Uncharacterised protein [Bordetella pertussis]|nr:Uncharacterised protein [Bordetella pertussis]CFU43789.1 Uncharacterised protein [Bordetella pertussis]CFV99937.1 Uncharacterised protein [Bordetella pertussis]CRE02336.1 Uncharacterised protein [Bordetella pertussis]
MRDVFDRQLRRAPQHDRRAPGRGGDRPQIDSHQVHRNPAHRPCQHAVHLDREAGSWIVRVAVAVPATHQPQRHRLVGHERATIADRGAGRQVLRRAQCAAQGHGGAQAQVAPGAARNGAYAIQCQTGADPVGSRRHRRQDTGGRRIAGGNRPRQTPDAGLEIGVLAFEIADAGGVRVVVQMAHATQRAMLLQLTAARIGAPILAGVQPAQPRGADVAQPYPGRARIQGLAWQPFELRHVGNDQVQLLQRQERGLAFVGQPGIDHDGTAPADTAALVGFVQMPDGDAVGGAQARQDIVQSVPIGIGLDGGPYARTIDAHAQPLAQDFQVVGHRNRVDAGMEAGNRSFEGIGREGHGCGLVDVDGCRTVTPDMACAAGGAWRGDQDSGAECDVRVRWFHPSRRW